MNADTPLSSLLQLPVELLASIIELLDLSSGIRFRRTCKHLRDICNQCRYLQYLYMLASTGMVNNSSYIPLIQRLNLLRNKGLLMIARHKHPVTSLINIPELKMQSNFSSNFTEGVFHLWDSKRIHFHILPAQARGSNFAPHWDIRVPELQTSGLVIRTVGIDVPQNLLVVCTSGPNPDTLNLYPSALIDVSLKPHWLAQERVLVYQPLTVASPQSQFTELKICGDKVMLMVTAYDDDDPDLVALTVFNWKTGLCIFQDEMQYHGYEFLSQDYMLYLEIIDYDELGNDIFDHFFIYLVVYDLNSNRMIARFELPVIRGQPTFYIIDTKSASDVTAQKRAFVERDTTDRIIVMSVEQITQDDVYDPLCAALFAVPISYLLHLATQSNVHLSPSYKWEEWGPPGVRILHRYAEGGAQAANLGFFTCGMRMYLPAVEDESTVMEIFDFTELPARFAKGLKDRRGLEAGPSSNIAGYTEECVTESPMMFTRSGQPITSSLPYMVISDETPVKRGEISSVYFNQDAVIWSYKGNPRSTQFMWRPY